MPKQTKAKVLIVDDMASNISLLSNLLKEEYETFFAKNGLKALEIAKKKRPDVILLDIVMPIMDGYEVCRRLKENPATRDIPVIFVTAMGEEDDETRGFEIGAEDYIVKPFKSPIVKARVATHVKLKQAVEELRRLRGMALDANPMTGLAGANSVAAVIREAMRNGAPVCVVYADLDNLRVFNEKYGFERGDEVILFTAEVLRRAILDAGCGDAFVGHVGGDDFVLAVPSELRGRVARGVMDHFDGGIKKFYSREDAEAGCISAVNREGSPQLFPIMSISMAAVDLSYGAYGDYIEVNDACEELKKNSKAKPGSYFSLDQRGKTG